MMPRFDYVLRETTTHRISLHTAIVCHCIRTHDSIVFPGGGNPEIGQSCCA